MTSTAMRLKAWQSRGQEVSLFRRAVPCIAVDSARSAVFVGPVIQNRQRTLIRRGPRPTARTLQYVACVRWALSLNNYNGS